MSSKYEANGILQWTRKKYIRMTILIRVVLERRVGVNSKKVEINLGNSRKQSTNQVLSNLVQLMGFDSNSKLHVFFTGNSY